MAIYIKGPDSAGDCCECSERLLPCDTCRAPPPSCCSFPEFFGNGSIETSNYGCYALHSISGYADTIGAGATASIVDSGPIDTFAPNNITLSRNTTYSASTSALFESAGAGSSANWRIALTTDADFTISAVGQIQYHDCPSAAADIYSYNTDDCTIDDFTPVLSLDFRSGPPCTLPIVTPQEINQSHNVSLAAGSYAILFDFRGGFVSSQNGICGFPSCNGGLDVTVTIAGTNFVPLRYDDIYFNTELVDCRRMLLPPLTRATNSWYASQSSAQSAITNNTSNCIGYCSTTPFTSFTATEAPTSLTLECVANAILTSSYGRGHVMYARLNLTASSTLSVECTISNTVTVASLSLDLNIYGANDVLLDTQSVNTTIASTFTHTFTYLVAGTRPRMIRVTMGATGGPTPFVSTATAVATSTGTISVNDIQALYDVGLDCPARLDC